MRLALVTGFSSTCHWPNAPHARVHSHQQRVQSRSLTSVAPAAWKASTSSGSESPVTPRMGAVKPRDRSSLVDKSPNITGMRLTHTANPGQEPPEFTHTHICRHTCQHKHAIPTPVHQNEGGSGVQRHLDRHLPVRRFQHVDPREYPLQRQLQHQPHRPDVIHCAHHTSVARGPWPCTRASPMRTETPAAVVSMVGADIAGPSAMNGDARCGCAVGSCGVSASECASKRGTARASSSSGPVDAGPCTWPSDSAVAAWPWS